MSLRSNQYIDRYDIEIGLNKALGDPVIVFYDGGSVNGVYYAHDTLEPGSQYKVGDKSVISIFTNAANVVLSVITGNYIGAATSGVQTVQTISIDNFPKNIQEKFKNRIVITHGTWDSKRTAYHKEITITPIVEPVYCVKIQTGYQAGMYIWEDEESTVDNNYVVTSGNNAIPEQFFGRQIIYVDNPGLNPSQAGYDSSNTGESESAPVLAPGSIPNTTKQVSNNTTTNQATLGGYWIIGVLLIGFYLSMKVKK
jgi:hypothetical protein